MTPGEAGLKLRVKAYSGGGNELVCFSCAPAAQSIFPGFIKLKEDSTGLSTSARLRWCQVVMPEFGAGKWLQAFSCFTRCDAAISCIFPANDALYFQ